MTSIVVAEIEYSYPLRTTLIGVPYETPVWHFTLWVDYEKTLSFMADSDTTYNVVPFKLSNLYIDWSPYSSVATLAACVAAEMTYYLSGADLYVHFADHLPPMVFASIVAGRLFGFTNRGVRKYDGFSYLPEVASVPDLEESVDPLEYSMMAMQGGSATLRNFLATFDGFSPVFGNDFRVLVGLDTGAYADLTPVQRFFIREYSVKLGSTTFQLKDRRELLSVKCPFDSFTTAVYPDIESEHVDKVIPDAFGALLGVPGICVNGEASGVKTFKFGSVITSITAVYVYKSEKWTAVTPDSIDYAAGTVTLSVANAHVDGSASKGIVKVKADGVFRPETNPGDIIAKLNEVYAGVPFTAAAYDLAEWAAELAPLADIGLYLGERKDLFEWIAAVQNGSTVGFQYMTNNGLITARLDNPNRTENVRSILAIDIINLGEVEADYSGTQYATYSRIGYARDHEAKKSLYVENTDYRNEVREIHRQDKEYATDSLLALQADAAVKAWVAMDDLRAVRPIYKSIRLFGAEWFAVRLYDVLYADLSVPAPTARPDKTTRLVTLGAVDDIEVTLTAPDDEVITPSGSGAAPAAGRDFAGLVRCQVVRRRLGLDRLTVELDLRQRDESDAVAAALA